MYNEEQMLPGDETNEAVQTDTATFTDDDSVVSKDPLSNEFDEDSDSEDEDDDDSDDDDSDEDDDDLEID